jgi:membrane protease subunit HflK
MKTSMQPDLTAPAEEAGSRALNDAMRSSLRILKFLMVLVAAVVVFSGVFTVEPNEVAIVLRFGKPTGVGADQVLRPGLHWAFPYPIDEIVRVPAGQSHTVTSGIGWYALTPEQQARGEEPPARGTLTPGADGYLLAGDGNIFHARATLKYRISDPVQYAFAFGSASNVLQSLLNNALLHAASGVTAESAIYRDKLAFRDAILAGLSEGLTRHPLGVTLDPFDVQVVAPVDVRPAFEAVLAAEQERSQKINEARGYANEVTLKAGGQAQAIISEGITASNKLVLTVAGQAKFFTDQLPYYRADVALFRRRLLAETMETVLASAQDMYLLPHAGGGQPQQVRLQFNREPPRAKTPEAVKP